MKDCAVIFDVDGVLLELTRPEEEIFFEALSRFVPTQDLSRDWNSYRIRNDDDIIAEILERNGLAPATKAEVIEHYVGLLDGALASGSLTTMPIKGAASLLGAVSDFAATGIATANLREAARLRLETVQLWPMVQNHAFGADGGGHKHQILARAIASTGLPAQRIVYVGDNINDVIAGRENNVHFVGFSTDAGRRRQLANAGTRNLAENHGETLGFIRQFLAS